MLTDSFIFLNNNFNSPRARSSRCGRYHHDHYYKPRSSINRYFQTEQLGRGQDFERDGNSIFDDHLFLATDNHHTKQQEREQEQRRQYEAAMIQQNAYLEAMSMERRRQQHLLEEKREQYLLELERKRYEREQEDRKRQYRTALLLEQQRLHNEKKEKAKAKAEAEAAKALEEAKQEYNQPFWRTGSGCHVSNPMRQIGHHAAHPIHQIVQTPDAGLYRVFIDTGDDDNDGVTYPQYGHGHTLSNCYTAPTDRGDSQPVMLGRTLYTNDLPANRTPAVPSSSPRRIVNVQFKDCSNNNNNIINKQSLTNKSDAVTDLQPKKNQASKREETFLQKKQKQLKLKESSVLVGGVEDASDSECEEDFNDYWHNRRPQSGKWIEPIDRIAML